MMKVCAVLVTYNRLELLKESISAITKQTYPINELLVINNDSSDGTAAYLEAVKEKIPVMRVVNTETNIGGAGGFSLGMELATNGGENDFLWIMDDDTIPNPECLKNLIAPFEDSLISDTAFTCSNVRWTDGNAALMNIPYANNQWNDLADKGLVAVNAASFVSLLVPVKAIKMVGLPITEFFVWGDDYEFTLRLSDHAKCYCVLNSLVVHKMGVNQGVDIVTDGAQRIPRYYYSYRNSIYTESHHGGVHGLTIQIMRDLYAVGKVIAHSSDHRLSRINIIFRGMFSGFFFHPSIRFPKEKEI